MLRCLLLKRLFAINPDRSKRFFTLRFKLETETGNENEAYKRQVQSAEEECALLFAGRSDNKQYFHIFQSANQIEPYEFLKETPFYQNKMISEHRIEEIEMKVKGRDKQLAPRHLRDQ